MVMLIKEFKLGVVSGEKLSESFTVTTASSKVTHKVKGKFYHTATRPGVLKGKGC